MNASGSPSALFARDILLRSRIPAVRGPGVPGGEVLLTGATGFVGRYVARELLRRTDTTVHCLVRAENVGQARARLTTALAGVVTGLEGYRHRIRVWPGSVEQRRLGLSRRDYDILAERVSTICHCAATVNWVASYRRLRDTNVLGTLEVIRLAGARGPKRIIFTSTLAVCFPVGGPDMIDESTELQPYIDRMPLGYAQSKCVAECLLKHASLAGVPVCVVRPALISGDSETGDVNDRDLIAELVRSCTATGVASDTDWRLDCVPVDSVARLIVALGACARPGWEVLNLFNAQSRDWREFVLWMTLRGYPVQLVPHAEWLARTFSRDARCSGLYRYRGFFGAGRTTGAAAPFEAFLEPAQGRIRNEVTRRAMTDLDLSIPPLTTDLLGRYFETYADKGVVPVVRHRLRGAVDAALPVDVVERGMREHAESLGQRIVGVRELAFASTNGIFNEVASAGAGSRVGIRRFEITLGRGGDSCSTRLQVLLKSKPADTVMQDLLVEVARLCDKELGACFRDHRNDLGLGGAHLRELELYEIPDPRLRAIAPRPYATCRDPRQGLWSVLMEYFPQQQPGVGSASGGQWTRERTQAAIEAISGVHAAWFGKDRELARLPWMAPSLPLERAIDLTGLWRRLVGYSGRFTCAWTGAAILPLQESIIGEVRNWWPLLTDLPRTLIHNDFNPRNLLLRADGSGPRVVVLDWELAGVGLPQHDTAELLCFTMPPAFDAQALWRLLHAQRRGLQEVTGAALDPNDWIRGFLASLKYLGIFRLPMYTLMYRFRKLPYLPDVFRNWWVLYRFAEALSAQCGARPCDQPRRKVRHGNREQVLRP